MRNTGFNFNDAQKQNSYELIPSGTIATLVTTVKCGQFDEANGGIQWVSKSKTGNDMLSMEFTIVGGDHDQRKIWQTFVIDENSKTARNISMQFLRAMWESANGIDPDDISPEAINKRNDVSVDKFEGLSFMAEIGISKGKDGYKDKNCLKSIITCENEAYIQPVQSGFASSDSPAAVSATGGGIGSTSSASASAANIPTPDWAK
jgi:hypothetical protein